MPPMPWGSKRDAQLSKGLCLGVQVENEFGFVGPNEPYLRHITDTARQGLGNEVVLYSTDPPSVITKGTLGGSDGILA